jgi:Icc-related predicted phosphoesterase
MPEDLSLVLVSDTHGYHRRISVPPGDVLIHAGDMTETGALSEVEEFNQFLGELPHSHKIVIAGNHDFCFESAPREARSKLTNATYLEDEQVVVEGVTIYGSPWKPWFYDWAFNLRRGREIAAKWAQIPFHTDILVTHGPPAGIGDLTLAGINAGCEDLSERIGVVKPRLHVFGHIHEARGVHEEDGTSYVNASVGEGGAGIVVFEWGVL